MDEKILREAALDYHRAPTPGKISVTPTKGLINQRDLSLAYSPGVAYACLAIKDDANEAVTLTSRANLVAVITNGSAVLGLGNIGAPAGKPVMEGKSCLFKKFAGIDVFDIEINESEPDKFVEIVASLEPTFGGINLEAAHQQATHVFRQIKRRLAGQPLQPWRYRDFGSPVSLGEYSTVGSLMGGLMGGRPMNRRSVRAPHVPLALQDARTRAVGIDQGGARYGRATYHATHRATCEAALRGR